MINLVFLLLVLFMLMGVIAPDRVLDPDPARAILRESANGGGHQLLVSADGHVAFADRLVAVDELASLASGALSARPQERQMQVLADRAAEAALVVEVLSVLRTAGFEVADLVAVSHPTTVAGEPDTGAAQTGVSR